MSALFGTFIDRQAFPDGYAERISSILPESIRKLPCFLDRLTSIWRYDCGAPITLDGGGTFIGANMFHSVAQLFEVVCCADWRLSEDKLSVYSARLSDPSRHEDVLVEFAPILRLGHATIVDHEVSGGGKGTVDWSIDEPGYPRLLLEVKNRVGGLVESLETIHSQSPDQQVPAPTHDHTKLFKSVSHKFKPRNADETIQGVWIKAGLLQEEKELFAAFNALDHDLIHAAILGSWGKEGHVIARDKLTKKRVQEILRLRSSKRLVFNRT